MLFVWIQMRCPDTIIVCNTNTWLKVDFSTVNNVLDDVRTVVKKNVHEYFASPYAELLLGIVVGIDELYSVYYFRKDLVATGTIHVAVVSGYNIGLVTSILLTLLKPPITKTKYLLLVMTTLFYSLLSGFEAPVVRAWIMSLLVLLMKSLGRPINAMDILLTSAFIMLFIRPEYLLSISFQLSFLATFGLIYLGDVFTFLSRPKNVILNDLNATICAQIFVLPLIAYYFNSISVVSPFVNALALWTMPLITVIGFVFIFACFIHPLFALITSKIVYIPLYIFVTIVDYFSELPIPTPNVIPSISGILFYYIFIFISRELLRRTTKDRLPR